MKRLKSQKCPQNSLLPSHVAARIKLPDLLCYQLFFSPNLCINFAKLILKISLWLCHWLHENFMVSMGVLTQNSRTLETDAGRPYTIGETGLLRKITSYYLQQQRQHFWQCFSISKSILSVNHHICMFLRALLPFTLISLLSSHLCASPHTIYVTFLSNK